MEKRIAKIEKHKPDASPFLRRTEAIRLLKVRSILETCERNKFQPLQSQDQACGERSSLRKPCIKHMRQPSAIGDFFRPGPSWRCGVAHSGPPFPRAHF